MVVNYREQRIAPLVAFLLFVPVCLIFFPVWEARHLAGDGGFAGRVLIAPAMGLFYLYLIFRTFTFNARGRRDPRALQWDALGLSVWQDGRSARVQWAQVDEVSIQQAKRQTNPSFLKIATRAADGRHQRWRYASSRLQLAGQPLDRIAAEIEHARNG